MIRFLLISFCFHSRGGRVGRRHIFVGFSLVFEFHMEGWPSAKHKIRWFSSKTFWKKEHMQSLSTVAVFDIWGQKRRIHTKLNENDMQRTLNFNKMHFEAWSFSPTISLFSTAGTLVVVTVPSIRPTKLEHKAPKVHYVLQLPPPPSAAYAIKIWKLFCIWYNKDRFYADILWSLISKENAECSNISFL